MKMRSLSRSLRWQVQVWHGLLLFVVLAAFGGTAFWFVRETQMRRVDDGLQQQLAGLLPPAKWLASSENFRRSSIPGQERFGFSPGRSTRQPPQFAGSRAAEPRNSLDAISAEGFYCVVWSAAAKVLYRSTNAPEAVPLPAAGRNPVDTSFAVPEPNLPEPSAGSAFRPSGQFMPAPLPGNFRLAVVVDAARTRGDLREMAWVDGSGYRLVVGRRINVELAELRRLAWLFVGIGLAVLLSGLLIGWWLSARAIRPIKDIVATAQKIANGNLSERINPTEASSELAELTQVLNETFDRLQAAFIRQSQFAADASHELRTPAFIILSQAQSALKRPRSAEEYREGFEVCQRAARQMGQIIESLLILARQDAGEINHRPESCALETIAAEAVDLLRGFAGERHVSLHAEIRPAPVFGDRNQLRQVVINLLNNAIEYNRAHGEVWLAVATQGGEVVLTVTDNGPGISPVDLPHVFERFYRADRSRFSTDGHTGLGLAICKAIVEMHGGRIEAGSPPGAGAVFTVRLPAGR